MAWPEVRTRPATVADAPLIHTLYSETPGYFEIISIPIPTLAEVETELRAADGDPRRFVELVYVPTRFGNELSRLPHDNDRDQGVVGYLDYKLDYPEVGDAMVNLLLIHGRLQSRGIGRSCVVDLEQRLSGRVRRILASIYGQNPRAERFWRSLGYAFAIDAKPILDWYAKEL